MPETTRLEFDRLPSPLTAYAKVLTGSRAGLKPGETVSRIEGYITDLSVDKTHLTNYNRVCGFDNKPTLSLSFPHVLASPLHMHMLTAPAFPVRLLGLVHVRNRITQHRRIQANEKLTLNCWLEGHKEVAAGQTFEMQTQITVGDEVVWESTNTFLKRKAQQRKGSSKKIKPKTEAFPSNTLTSTWRVPSDSGRKYANVSGDYNPIHQYDITAKLFGFKKAIATGMWSMARCVAELDEHLPDAYTLDITFKLPVFMPCNVMLKYWPTDNGVELRLFDEKGNKPHLAGKVTFL